MPQCPPPRRSPCRVSHRAPCRLRPRGFILLFGTRETVSDDATVSPVAAVCPQCRQRAQIVGKAYRTWFTAFFIPLFPISGARKFSQCTNCGAQFSVPVQELGRQVAAAEQGPGQRAIQLYNSLRHSPGNSVTLNELMTLYASIQEHDQAVAAAREFPAALEASEQCMVTLGRVHLAKNQHAEALRWFDAAAARNETLAEAQYYKAVAHLTATPPNYAGAVAAARAARSHGYPQADELLREAETRARSPT